MAAYMLREPTTRAHSLRSAVISSVVYVSGLRFLGAVVLAIVGVSFRCLPVAAGGVLAGERVGDGVGAGVDVDAEGAEVLVAGQAHEHGGRPAVLAEVGQPGVAQLVEGPAAGGPLEQVLG